MKKKILAIVMAAMMAVAVFAVPTSAANTTDKEYHFTLPANANYFQYTSYRSKETYSSIYIKQNSNSPASGTLYSALGYNYSQNSGDECMHEYGSSNYYNYGKIYTPGSYELHQFVRENGYIYASLGAKNGGFQSSYGVSGVWSPDCAGSYTDCN